MSSLEERMTLMKSMTTIEIQTQSEALRTEINRLDKEIIKRNDDIRNNKVEIDFNKNYFEEKIHELRESSFTQLVEQIKQFSSDMLKLEADVKNKYSEIVGVKSEVVAIDSKLSRLISTNIEDLSKNIEAARLQISHEKEEITRLSMELINAKQDIKISKLDVENKLHESLEKNKIDLLRLLNEMDLEIKRLNEDINARVEVITTFKRDSEITKIMIDEKISGMRTDYTNDIRKGLELIKLDMTYLRNDFITEGNNNVALRGELSELNMKIEGLKQEYPMLLKSGLEGIQIEINTIEQELRNKAHDITCDHLELVETRKTLEERFNLLRNENVELRRVINALKVDLTTLDEHSRRAYEDKYSMRQITNMEVEGQLVSEVLMENPHTGVNYMENGNVEEIFPQNQDGKIVSIETTIIPNSSSMTTTNFDMPRPGNVSVLQSSKSTKYVTQVLANLMVSLENEVTLESDSNVFSILFLEEHKEYDCMISGHKDGAIVCWDMSLLTKFKVLKEHTSFVDDLKAIKGVYFASCSKDRTVKIWDVTQNASVRTLQNDCWNYSLTMLKNYNNDYLAVGDDNKNIKIWNFEKGNKVATIPTEHINGVGRLLHISNKAPYHLILSSSNPDIKLWDLDNNKCVRQFNEHKGWVNAMIYLRDDFFATGSADSTIKIWSLFNSNSLRTINAHTSYVACLLYINDFMLSGNPEIEGVENVIISGSLGKTMKIIDSGSGDVLRSYERNESIFKMSFVQRSTESMRIAGIYWGSKNIKIFGNAPVKQQVIHM